MFGTVLGRALRSLRANRWNQDRTESTANRQSRLSCSIQPSTGYSSDGGVSVPNPSTRKTQDEKKEEGAGVEQ